MSLFSLRKPTLQSREPDEATRAAGSKSATTANRHPLDALTGGAFSAPTSGERAARVREWLSSGPSAEQMGEVFRELSQRDRGAAKPLKEKLDEQRRLKSQEQIAADWAQRAEALLAQSRLNLADAMAWQRDAARAGAPLSREPLLGLRQSLSERVKAVEDLQHRVQVEREAAVLMAQRIEVMSTKSWREAQQQAPALRLDFEQWQRVSSELQSDAQWPSVEAKFPPMLQASRSQLQLVWDAFEAALAQAIAADADAQAPLPAVPVWAEELRLARGEPLAEAQARKAQDALASQERRAQAAAELERLLGVLDKELTEGHGKATPKAAADLRAFMKAHGRLVGTELEARAHGLLKQAGDLEDWQRWRADQLREELVKKAEGLLTPPESQRLGGRKMQEALRALREQWKATDQGGAANHALWKRFDEACTEAHKVVEGWLAQVRQQADQHRSQRLALIEALKTWSAEHAADTDWKLQWRELQGFSERWRDAGHLSEKAFAELQPLWKAAMQQAHAPLEAAQAQSLARRHALIEEAVALGAASPLRLDAVKDLQQRWQGEAHAVPLDRKLEQKLWESFRQPIDDAFKRKSSEREKAAAALNAHDQRVLDASKAVQAAVDAGNAAHIRSALAALEGALRGEPLRTAPPHQALESAGTGLAASPADPAAAMAAPAAEVDAAPARGASAAEQDAADPAAVAPGDAAAEAPAAPPAVVAPVRKVVAVRGDDRPGMKKAQPMARDDRRGRDRDGRPGPSADGGRPGERDGREGREGRNGRDARGGPFGERGARGFDHPAPRLGDAAFRAQRQALELADSALRKLAAQAHGEVLTQLLTAWEQRDASLLPTAQALGSQVGAPARQAWSASLSKAPQAPLPDALLRLEIAAEVPTPADQLEARRKYQLVLLTQRNQPAPPDTWATDVARVLAGGHDPASARRLQAALKSLLRRS